VTFPHLNRELSQVNTSTQLDNGHARVVVMFGSQSGNAEQLAKSFGRQLERARL